MSLVQIRDRFQITIPSNVREKLGIKVGDIVEVEVKDTEVVLKPKGIIDKDQLWFWTDEWQKMEKEAQEDIEAGRVIEAGSMKELIKKLKKK